MAKRCLIGYQWGDLMGDRPWIRLLMLFCSLPVGAQTADLPKHASAGWFRVDARDPGFSVWQVTANLRATSGKIFTGAGGDAGYLERRWAGQVEDLQVSTPQGDVVETVLQKDSEDFYRFWALSLNGEPYLGPVALEYKLNLGYTRDKHPYGNEQGGQVFEEAVYTVAKPLFVGSDVSGTWRVEFQVPQGWRVATPLKPVHSTEWVFQAPSLDALHVNPLVIGRFGEVRSLVGGFEFLLVLPGEFTQFADDIKPVVTPILTLYQRLFPETPAGRYQMVMFRSYANDGEGYRNGSVITTTQAIQRENRVIWGNFLAHELFHYWNGTRLKGDPYWERQWFSEGFTEYYAVLAQVNLGSLSESLFIKRLEQHFGHHLYFHHSGLFKGVTVREAGKKKGDFRFGVYSSGFALALALDLAIQDATNGERTLDDFMGLLYRRFALQGMRYRFDDLVAAAPEIAGREMEPFFQRYVSTRNPLDVAAIFFRFGFIANQKPYAGELILVRDEHAAPERRAAWKGLIRHRFDYLNKQE